MANKYATVGQSFDGMNFRLIARKMTRAGFKMNHATARNVLHQALFKVACAVSENSGDESCDVMELARSAAFQGAIGAMVQDIYTTDQ